MRASVVLPQPDSPTSATISPRPTARSTPSTRPGEQTAAGPEGASTRPDSPPAPTPGSRALSHRGADVHAGGRCCRTRPARSRDVDGPAHLDGSGQRGWNGQPLGQVARPRRVAGQPARGEPRRRVTDRGERRRQRARVRVPRADRAPRRTGPPRRSGRRTSRRPGRRSAEHGQVVADDDEPEAAGRARARSSRSSTCACTITSSAVVGSSATISRGSQASAIAIITRCFWPPESWCGYDDGEPRRRARRRTSSRPTRFSACAPGGRTVVQQDRLGDLPARRGATGSASAARPGRRSTPRTSAPRAAGRTTSTARPRRRAARGRRPSRTAGVSRSTVAASVDLPDPDSPATPRLVPASTSSVTPRTAGTSPSALR